MLWSKCPWFYLILPFVFQLSRKSLTPIKNYLTSYWYESWFKKKYFIKLIKLSVMLTDGLKNIFSSGTNRNFQNLWAKLKQIEWRFLTLQPRKSSLFNPNKVIFIIVHTMYDYNSSNFMNATVTFQIFKKIKFSDNFSFNFLMNWAVSPNKPNFLWIIDKQNWWLWHMV